MARQQVTDAVLPGLIDAERIKDNNPGPANKEETARAGQNLVAFFLSPEGIGQIAGATPGPCGNGHLSQHVEMPDPFPATTADVNFLDVTLGDGHLNILVKAHADVFCGSASMEQPLTVPLIVDKWGQLTAGPPAKGNPVVDVSTNLICKIAIAFLSAVLLGLPGLLLAVIVIVVVDSLAKGLVASKLGQRSFPGLNVSQDQSDKVILKSVVVAPDGMLLNATVPWIGSAAGERFVPQADLVAKQVKADPSSTIPPFVGTYNFAGTKYGCPPQSFSYTVRYWDIAWEFHIVAKDVALPITVSGWQVTLGYAHGFDPRPSFNNGATVSIAAPSTLLSGYVASQVPPIEGFVEPRQLVAIQAAPEVSGWTLQGRGEDKNFFLLVEAVVTDASGQVFPVQQSLFFPGETIEFGEDYKKAMKECELRYRLWLETQHFGLIANTTKFTPIWDPHELIAGVIRQGILENKPGTMAQLSQLMTQQGEQFGQLVINGASTNPALRTLRSKAR
jgi:hypothetical protein